MRTSTLPSVRKSGKSGRLLGAALVVVALGSAAVTQHAAAASVSGSGAWDLIAQLLLASKSRSDPSAEAPARSVTIARAARLKEIERLQRSGKSRDSGSLMPMLKDPDDSVRRQAEHAIWSVWGRSGNADIDRLFRVGVAQLGRNEIEHAINTFTSVVDNLPGFAEAWNKRATARFLAGDLAGAMEDCEQALALVPDHFGSLAGYGHIYFRLDDMDMAILYWQRALEVNPNLDSVARSIQAAEKILVGRGRLRT